MAANLRYHRATDRITPTWLLSTATTAAARTGYGTTQINDGDPSSPFWADSRVVRLDGDFGAATRIDSVYLFAHNYSSSADLRIQLHSSSTLGTTSPAADIAVTVPTPHPDGFTYHLAVDVATAVPVVGTRTKRYLTVVNNSTNAVSVAIGEIVVYGSQRTLARNIRTGMSQPRERLTSPATSKRGVLTVYDYGSIDRKVLGEIPASQQDFEDLRALEADARGSANPFVIQVTYDSTTPRMAEPMFVRLASLVSGAPQELPFEYIPVQVEFQELGQGELIGA